MPTARGWCKRIEVASASRRTRFQPGVLRVDDISSRQEDRRPAWRIHKPQAGTIRRSRRHRPPGERLARRPTAPEYDGLRHRRDQPRRRLRASSPTTKVGVGEAHGRRPGRALRAQIRYTLEEHFRKQGRRRERRRQGPVAVLHRPGGQLRDADGLIRSALRASAYAEARARLPSWRRRHLRCRPLLRPRRTRRRRDEWCRHDTGETKPDRATYELIIQRIKNASSPFAEPVAFILFHIRPPGGLGQPQRVPDPHPQTRSRLGGQRRQEVGRGVRLPSTRTGESVQDRG